LGLRVQTDELRKLAIKSGVDLFGITPITRVEHIEIIKALKNFLSSESSIIVLGIHFFGPSVERAGEPPAESAVSYAYVQYQVMRELLKVAIKLSKYLNNRGYSALPIVDFSDGTLRTLCGYGEFHLLGLPDIRANSLVAVAAGLGEIGWNGMLLTPEYGPRQRTMGIITDAPLEYNDVYRGKSLCDKCFLCVEACPAKALSKTEYFTLRVEDRAFECGKVNEIRCAWARCYGLVADEGPKYMGWKTPDLEPPEKLSPEIVSKALRMKDPLQSIAYRFPYGWRKETWTDTIIERCLQVCLPPHPRGRKT
jgi:ferredoxin